MGEIWGTCGGKEGQRFRGQLRTGRTSELCLERERELGGFVWLLDCPLAFLEIIPLNVQIVGSDRLLKTIAFTSLSESKIRTETHRSLLNKCPLLGSVLTASYKLQQVKGLNMPQ